MNVSFLRFSPLSRACRGLFRSGLRLFRGLAVKSKFLAIAALVCPVTASAESDDEFLPLPTGREAAKGTAKDAHFAGGALRRFNERYKAAASKAAAAEKAKGGRQPKIVGGSESPPGAYPWMAALVRPEVADNYQAQFCGATLIHPYWVVTAAHCVEDTVPGSVEVLLGAHDLSMDTAVQRLAVAEIIIHPEYRGSTMDADLALLRLAEPADPAFVPVRLIDDADFAAPGVMARILGWGTTSEGGSSPRALREADIPVVAVEAANAPGVYNGELTPVMLPAGLQQGGKDTCQGDSGGPLVVGDPGDGGWLLAGITSFGDGCGRPNAYGIYTRVSHFRPFILEHLWPGYAGWERSRGVAGETRDPDGNGRDHFGEFALGEGAGFPPRAGFHIHGGGLRPSLSLRVRGWDGEAAFGFEHTSSLAGPWTVETVGETLVSATPAAGMEGAWDITLAASLPPPPRLFLRASARPSGALVPGVRGFDTTTWANGALAAGDAAHPQFPGRFARTYRLENLTPGAPVEITGRSRDFDMRLELLDAAGEALVIASADAAGGVGGRDERIAFTPAAGTDYHLRVTPAGDGGAGSFHLGCLRPSAFNALPEIGVPAGRSGTLAASDPPDPLWLPLTFYADDYRLTPAASGRIRVTLNSSAFDAYLEIVDAETGRLIVADDDGGGGLNSQLVFTPVPGAAHIIRVTSADIMKTGGYTLATAQLPSLPGIAVPQTIAGSLAASDEQDPNYPGTYKDDYRLTGVTPGQTVTIRMNSTQLDAYLFLLDAVGESILDQNDDRSGFTTDSEIVFTVEAGREYLIRASSYDPGATGSYSLTTF